MARQKILIIDMSEEFRDALADALGNTYEIHCTGDGEQGCQMALSDPPDLLVLDLILPRLDGISLLQEIRKNGIHPLIMVITRNTDPFMQELALREGVNCILAKPCSLRGAVARIRDLCERPVAPALPQSDGRVLVSGLLLQLGLSTKLRGFGYLREAVLLKAKDPGQAITKELYPAVARQCGVGSGQGALSAEQVEHGIRTAIRAAWEHRNIRVWAQFFPLTEDGDVACPTNGMLISRLAEALRFAQEASMC